MSFAITTVTGKSVQHHEASQLLFSTRLGVLYPPKHHVLTPRDLLRDHNAPQSTKGVGDRTAHGDGPVPVRKQPSPFTYRDHPRLLRHPHILGNVGTPES
jgi:hypothetical protein